MMKRLIYLVLSVAVLAGCHKDDDDSNASKPGKDFTETLAGVSFDMVYVKGSTFTMGDDADLFAKPAHQVTLTKDYYIGKYEVTQGVWEKVMGTTLEEQRDKSDYPNSLYGKGANYPMYYVNWAEAQEFCDKLSQLTGRKYALPTEAQWEYAARGGEKSKGYKYSGSNDIDEVAWYKRDHSWEKYATSRVGTKQPNELGIYDMSGNVYEWCSDRWGDYSSDAVTDPVGPAEDSYRVLRGGGWNDNAGYCRVSDRHECYPNHRYNFIGFRIVLLP